MNNKRSLENVLRLHGIPKSPLYNDRLDLNLVYSYELLIRLLLPFKEWDAYKSKIIDDNGNILINRKNMDNNQKKCFTKFDAIILKIKKALEKSNSSDMFMNKDLNSYTRTSLIVSESEIPTNITGPAIAQKDIHLSPSLLTRVKKRKLKKEDDDGRIITGS